jgi:ferredoxin
METTKHSYRFEATQLDGLIQALADRDYTNIGPVMRDNAIVYDYIRHAADLPQGWTDSQKPGHYRLKRTSSRQFFNFNLGAHNWKQYLLPADEPLWRAEYVGDKLIFEESAWDAPKQAFIGVRACELAALQKLGEVYAQGSFRDTRFMVRRQNLFIVAVNCTRAGGTCFCSSMGTGPEAISGFDIALTECESNGQHYFIAEAGTALGDELVAQLGWQLASQADIRFAQQKVADVAEQMGRQLVTEGLPERLLNAVASPDWGSVAKTCLSCGNCTMVCPTCFCQNQVEKPALDARSSVRFRHWDSCFSADFSYIHGGSIRQSTQSRYRQWMMHKLATWLDQFDTSGCVGCGRCITWCPVGIDITENAKKIAEVNHEDEGY